MSSVFSKPIWRHADFWKPSVLILIAANVIPLLGVLFLGWNTFAIVVIYWTENVIIGAINVLKMLCTSPSVEALNLSQFKDAQEREEVRALIVKFSKGKQRLATANHASKFFFVPFFVVHYGLFCFVHGVFIFTLLGGEGIPFGGPSDLIPHFWERLRSEHLLWAVLALTASHLFSFFTNFLGKGEYRRVTVPQLMFQPYGRIVILHFAILFGAFLIMAFGSPVWMLVILVVGKTMLDIGLHLVEHEKNAEPLVLQPIEMTNRNY